MSTTQMAGIQQLPKSGTWHVDTAHTSANFSARHLDISKVRGRFDALDGTLTIGDDPSESHVEVTIDTEARPRLLAGASSFRDSSVGPLSEGTPIWHGCFRSSVCDEMTFMN